ncbi:hypothetical protein PFISCL1PPCAC_19180, partial [Pristionchus fissidentatus]
FRVNKRLNQLELNVMNHVEELYLRVGRFSYSLRFLPLNARKAYGSKHHDRLVNGFSRLALNTSFNLITVFLPNIVQQGDGCSRVIDSVLELQCEKLSMFPPSDENDGIILGELPDMNLSRLLNLAGNATKADIKFICQPITAQDLCTIRETMLTRQCKMGSLSILVNDQVDNSFLKECYGVTMEQEYVGVVRERIYRSTNPDIEMWSRDPAVWLDLSQFEGNFETHIERSKNRAMCVAQNCIRFSVLNDSFVESKKTYHKLIKFDHI